MEGANISGADPNQRVQLLGYNLKVLRFLSHCVMRVGERVGRGGVVTLGGRTGSESVLLAVRTLHQGKEPEQRRSYIKGKNIFLSI